MTCPSLVTDCLNVEKGTQVLSTTPIKMCPAHNLPPYISFTYFDGFFSLTHYLKWMHMIFLVVSILNCAPLIRKIQLLPNRPKIKVGK